MNVFFVKYNPDLCHLHVTVKQSQKKKKSLLSTLLWFLKQTAAFQWWYLFHVGVTHCLCYTFPLIIARSRTNRVNMPPILLILWVYLWIWNANILKTFQTLFTDFCTEYKIELNWKRVVHISYWHKYIGMLIAGLTRKLLCKTCCNCIFKYPDSKKYLNGYNTLMTVRSVPAIVWCKYFVRQTSWGMCTDLVQILPLKQG